MASRSQSKDFPKGPPTPERRKPSIKHNPGFLSADEIIDSFIVRHAALESVLETLRSNTTATNGHMLVIGRRGMGKSMLVHRVALAIERDPELASRWYPIVFSDAAYNVGTAAELWLEALRQLAAQTNDPALLAAHVVLRRERDNQRLHDLSLARLLEFADERDVRLLVAVENLQDILGAQMNEEEGWALRDTMLNEPRIMLLATANARLDDIEKSKKAAYEQFGILQLRPLDRDAIRVVWERLTGERLEGQAYRVIEIFTGGNLRLLTVLAGFARGIPLREIMVDLLGLLDDHSDYFKSSFEALPLDERRVFMALCELWEPSPARAIGEVARFDVNKASMLLGRLVNRGVVEVVKVKGRAKYYQTCERLFSIFHQLRWRTTRHNRVASVVEFIARFYLAAEASSEAADMFREDDDRALELLSDLARDNPEALGDLLGTHRDALLQLAIARTEGLHAVVSTIPLFKPLAFALAQELGHDVLAPYEVTEVAKDIRAQLRRLRDSEGLTQVVDAPVLAAAEETPRPKRATRPVRRRKPSKRRLGSY
jgi:hypothetical protein